MKTQLIKLEKMVLQAYKQADKYRKLNDRATSEAVADKTWLAYEKALAKANKLADRFDRA